MPCIERHLAHKIYHKNIQLNPQTTSNIYRYSLRYKTCRKIKQNKEEQKYVYKLSPEK